MTATQWTHVQTHDVYVDYEMAFNDPNGNRLILRCSLVLNEHGIPVGVYNSWRVLDGHDNDVQEGCTVTQRGVEPVLTAMSMVGFKSSHARGA